MVLQNRVFQRIGGQVRTACYIIKSTAHVSCLRCIFDPLLDLDTRTARPKLPSTALPSDVRDRLGLPVRRTTVLKSCESKENSLKDKRVRK